MSEDALNPYQGRPVYRTKHDQLKTFTLPVSGGVRLYGAETDLISTREFQRLAGIRQLGTSYVVFRGATHTRFEHSLGALHEAERIIQGVRNNPKQPGEVIDSRAHRLIRLTALLHDLTHIPFGHTLEDEFQLLGRHDDNEIRFNAFFRDCEVAEILRNVLGDEDHEELLRILKAHTDTEIVDLEFPFIADIVANTVNADILDYVRRDLQACGMPVSLGTRFLEYFTITSSSSEDVALLTNRRRMALNLQKRGMPRPDVESEVLKLLNYRYELAERVYYHHAKNAASAMIARAVAALGLATGAQTPEEDRRFHWLSDESLLAILEHPTIAGEMGVELPTTGDLALSERLAMGVRTRDLYKIAYIATRDDLPHRPEDLGGSYGNTSARVALENRLARAARLEEGQVLVHLPPTKMMRKSADVRVTLHDGTVVTLAEWDAAHTRRAASLDAAHARLWRVTVYVAPEVEDSDKELVQAAAQEIFGAPSTYEVTERRPYREALFYAEAPKRRWKLEDRKAALDSAAKMRGDELDAQALADAMDDAVRIDREKRRKARRRKAT